MSFLFTHTNQFLLILCILQNEFENCNLKILLNKPFFFLLPAGFVQENIEEICTSIAAVNSDFCFP